MSALWDANTCCRCERAASTLPTVAVRSSLFNAFSEIMARSASTCCDHPSSARAARICRPVIIGTMTGKTARIGYRDGFSDLAAMYAVAQDDDGAWLIWGKQYCPRDQFRKRISDNLPYGSFEASGRLVITEGNSIDQDRIIADLV